MQINLQCDMCDAARGSSESIAGGRQAVPSDLVTQADSLLLFFSELREQLEENRHTLNAMLEEQQLSLAGKIDHQEQVFVSILRQRQGTLNTTFADLPVPRAPALPPEEHSTPELLQEHSELELMCGTSCHDVFAAPCESASARFRGLLDCLAAEFTRVTLLNEGLFAELEVLRATSNYKLATSVEHAPAEISGALLEVQELRPQHVSAASVETSVSSATWSQMSRVSHTEESRQSVWGVCRQEALSSCSFCTNEFLKACVYEFLPIFISAPLVILVEGRGVARARVMWPYNPFLDAVAASGMWTVFILSCVWFPLDEVNFWDSVFMLLLGIVRALTIGCKYATYGKQAASSIGSDWYLKMRRVEIQMMSTHILNVTGLQPIALLEQTFAAELMADCDLSHVTLHFVSQEETNHCNSIVKGRLETVTTVEAALRGSDADASQESPAVQQMHFMGISSRFIAVSREARLIMRQSDMNLKDASPRPGRISAITYALYLVYTSHSFKSRNGCIIFFGSVLLFCALGFSPLIVKACWLGQPPIGSSIKAQVLLLYQSLLLSFLMFLCCYYVYAPCLFYFRQYRLEALLHASMAEGQSDVPLADPETPTLDMTIPENVLGWAAVWRVLHGVEFNHSFQIRANFYAVVSFGAIIMGVLLQTIAFETGGGTFPVTSKIPVFLFLGAMAAPLCIQIIIAHCINQLASAHAAVLQRQRMNIAAMLETETGERRAAELKKAFDYLDVTEQEVSAKASARPIIVAFLKGDIIRLYSVATVLSVLMYSDMQRLQILITDVLSD